MARRDLNIPLSLLSVSSLLRTIIYCLSLCCLSDGGLVSAQSPTKTEKTAPPLFEFTFTDDMKREQTLEAAQILQAQDGGVVMLTRDGRLLTATPEQLKSKRPLDREFTPLDASELEKQLKAEFGDDFTVTQTKHFTICSQAGKRYSQWCGYLFERLYMVLHNYWDDKAHPLHEPEVPLIAVIFKDRANFEQYASQLLGDGAAATHGFYSIQSNRMVLYDLTAAPNERPAYTDADILFKLRKSPFNVATVIHECTHQIAFNVGLHTRFADNPLWLTEGMATYFETPDLKSKTGWRTVGKPNPWRLRQFQDYARSRRPADSLQTLISSDQRFQEAESLLDTYAEAWAFTYFLIKTKRRLYEEYLHLIAARQPLIWSTPAARLKDFQSVFGEDLNQLDQQFLRYMRQISR
ncbi:DUF1570 domain-containing protein [Gimesia algae]|uniref:DUF1570 domain-containing protein n=1 Tax=Gimesia algae TaxID=2527971 RepID=A0A517VMV4_9PLAN|nr:DUF1570 domain-containing protein [Gimesia algae]QDT94240.1 hypothetical protein Pan161_59340 [Gimesia algae]